MIIKISNGYLILTTLVFLLQLCTKLPALVSSHPTEFKLHEGLKTTGLDQASMIYCAAVLRAFCLFLFATTLYDLWAKSLVSAKKKAA